MKVWILCIAVLVAAWRSRPSAAERSALRRYPASARILVFLPLSPAWLKAVSPSDFVPLAAVRRRAMMSLLLLAALTGVGLWTSGSSGGGVPDREIDSGPVPLASPRPASEAPAPASRPRRDRAVEPSREPAPATETATYKSGGAAKEEPLAALRTPIRLYGTAKVSSVYEGYEFRGVRLENIQPGSFWELIGVEEGDVVVEVHGEALDDPAVGVALIKSLAQDSEVKLRVRSPDGSQRYLQFTAPE